MEVQAVAKKAINNFKLKQTEAFQKHVENFPIIKNSVAYFEKHVPSKKAWEGITLDIIEGQPSVRKQLWERWQNAPIRRMREKTNWEGFNAQEILHAIGKLNLK